VSSELGCGGLEVWGGVMSSSPSRIAGGFCGAKVIAAEIGGLVGDFEDEVMTQV